MTAGRQVTSKTIWPNYFHYTRVHTFNDLFHFVSSFHVVSFRSVLGFFLAVNGTVCVYSIIRGLFCKQYV